MFLTLDIKVGCPLKTIAERKQFLIHTYDVDDDNNDDNNANSDVDDDGEKPGRIQQTLPGPEKIGSDNLQENNLFSQK